MLQQIGWEVGGVEELAAGTEVEIVGRVVQHHCGVVLRETGARAMKIRGSQPIRVRDCRRHL